MKNLLKIGVMILILGVGSPVHAQTFLEKLFGAEQTVGGGTGTIETLNPFKVSSGTITPVNTANTLTIPTLGGNGTKCVQTDNNGLLSYASSACGTGSGGGSGGGTWSTTTSNVLNQFINYPNNTTDIVTIGGTATTTGKFFFDPNIKLGQIQDRLKIGSNFVATTTTVCSYGCDYTSIETAVDTAPASTTILIKNGTYALGATTITVAGGKTLDIIGESKEGVVITYTGSGNAFTIGDSTTITRNFRLENITISGSSSGTRGFSFVNVRNSTFSNLYAKGFTSSGNPGQAFRLDGTGGYTGDNEFYNLRCDTSDYCLNLSGTAVNANHFYGFTFRGTTRSISISNSNGNSFEGGLVGSPAGTGIVLTGTGDENRFDGIYCESNLLCVDLQSGANDNSFTLIDVETNTTMVTDAGSRNNVSYTGSDSGGKTYFNGGNFGIGTTTPGTALGIVGDEYLTGLLTASRYVATSTSASIFPYASTTALSGTTFCLSTDCRTAWPSSGGGAYPFPLTGNATSTLTGFNGGLFALASSTLQNFTGLNSTTTNATSTASFYSPLISANTVVAANFIDTSFTGNNCIGETSGVIGQGTNCVSSIASAGGTLTISSPTGNVDASLNLNSSNIWTASTTFQKQTNMQNASSTLLTVSDQSYLSTTTIGVGTALAPLTVYGSNGTNATLSLNNGTNNYQIGFLSSGSVAAVNGTTNNTSFGLRTNGTTRIQISGTGNVGVGTTTPGASFAVQGAAYFSSGLFSGQDVTSTSTFKSTSITDASIFPYASSTALTATNLFATTICLSGDTCRTSWPVGSGSAFPYTTLTNYGITTNSTTTAMWFKDQFFASSSAIIAGKVTANNFQATSTVTSVFPNASTTILTTGTNSRLISDTFDKSWAWASSTPDAAYKTYNSATSSRVVWTPKLKTGLDTIGCQVTAGSGTAHVAIGTGSASTTLVCTTTYASAASSVTWAANAKVFIAASSTAPSGVQDLEITGSFYNN